MLEKFADASRGGTSAADTCVLAPPSYLVCGSYISSRANASTLGSILISPCRARLCAQLALWNLSSLFVLIGDLTWPSCANLCGPEDQNLHNYIRGLTDHTERTCPSLVRGLDAKAERTTNAAVWRMWTSSEFNLLQLFPSGRKNQIC